MDAAPNCLFNYIEKDSNQDVVDCSACGSSGYAISGDLDLLEKLVMRSDARYIIVIEKVLILLRFDLT